MVSDRRYEEMRGFYEHQYEEMKRQIDTWFSKYINAKSERAELAGQCKLYKMILDRYMGGDSAKTDNGFMFEGKLYLPKEYHLERTSDEDGDDTLTVKFVLAEPNKVD